MVKCTACVLTLFALLVKLLGQLFPRLGFNHLRPHISHHQRLTDYPNDDASTLVFCSSGMGVSFHHFLKHKQYFPYHHTLVCNKNCFIYLPFKARKKSRHFLCVKLFVSKQANIIRGEVFFLDIFPERGEEGGVSCAQGGKPFWNSMVSACA